MTLFEYISIATTIVLSFSLSRTLSNMAPAFLSPARYWVHSLWVLGLLIGHVNMFWQLWLYQSVESWTLLTFVLLLLGPIMFLVCASLILPQEPADNYQAYFESVRVPCYGVLIAIQVQPIPLTLLLFDISLFHPIHILNLLFAVPFLVGLIMQKTWLDKVLVCIWFIGLLAGLAANNTHDAALEVLRSLQ